MKQLILVFALTLAGCKQPPPEPPPVSPPCDNLNPWFCGDGTCCNVAEPVCWGPDSTGYYCEPSNFDPNDPNWLSKARRSRARR